MNPEDAVIYLRRMYLAVEALRTRILKVTERDAALLAESHPEIFGEHGIRSRLVRLIAECKETPERLDSGDFYHMMYFAHHHAAIALMAEKRNESLPLPDLRWLEGWTEDAPLFA